MQTFHFEVFTTQCELQIDCDEQKAAFLANEIYSQSKRLEHTYSYFHVDSELYKVNHRESESLHVSDEFAGLITLSLFYSQVTKGAFDVAFAGTLKESKAHLEYASCDCIAIDGNDLKFNNSYTKIDFGGIVKEYAVDHAILFLKNSGITSALVNFGGDLAAIGSYHGSKWCIGIEDPFDNRVAIDTVEIDSNSLCTSGHTKRFKEIQGEKVSHIISNDKNDLLQISIVAPTTVDAGIWSTALLVNPELEPPEHVKLVKRVYN